ncbi:MAG: PrsW family glutamic-type intramembrane protease, partial [Candidatus Limnocylindrales bacterium]
VVGGPYSHVLLTGLTGMGLAWYVTRPDIAKSRRLLAAVLLYVAGVAAHFVWNSPLLNEMLGADPDAATWILWATIKGLPFLILLAVLVRVAIRREQGWVNAALADDVAAGVVTPTELETLGDLRRRREARREVAARKGVAGDRLTARLQHAQVALAVTESSTAPDRETRIAAARELITGLRGQRDALPDIGPAAAGFPPTPPAIFAPMHRVPPEGLASWALPNPAGASTPLAGGLELQVVQQVGDWAHVSASNGWTGWVDGRRIVPTSADR